MVDTGDTVTGARNDDFADGIAFREKGKPVRGDMAAFSEWLWCMRGVCGCDEGGEYDTMSQLERSMLVLRTWDWRLDYTPPSHGEHA